MRDKMNTTRSWFYKIKSVGIYLDDLELHSVVTIFGALADSFNDGVDE